MHCQGLEENSGRCGHVIQNYAGMQQNTNIKIKHLYVKEAPHSGTKDQLLDKYKINWKAYVDEVKKIIK